MSEMSKLSNPEYAEIADDIYLAYVQVLSVADDAVLEEVIAEYTVPAELHPPTAARKPPLVSKTCALGNVGTSPLSS